MDAEDFAVYINYAAHFRRYVQKVGVRSRIKILGVAFRPDFAKVFAGNFARFGFGHFAQRKKRLGKLALRKAVKEVGLVLAYVGGLLQIIALADFLNARIVSRGEIVKINAGGFGFFRKQSKFYQLVTLDAGVRCVSRQILLFKIGYDVLCELF